VNSKTEQEPTMTTADAIEVPHYEKDGGEDEAVWTVAEAMRLTVDSARVGRIEFTAGARRAVRALIAAGWTPPGDSTGEADRLRGLLEKMQVRMDEALAYSARAHEAEQDADNRRGSMAVTLNTAMFDCRNRAKVAKADGEPEPTLPVTRVADFLEKALRRGEQKKSAKAKPAAKPAETVAVTLPGMDGTP
jgi:hypothetical protein